MILKNLLLISIFITLSNFVSAGAWTKMADFGGATGRHRAIGLSIGNKGYMGTGHFNGTGVETYYSDWWEYDPSSNSWAQKADYIGNSGLGDLGLLSIEIPDINVGYVGLGELDPFSIYKYDPATNLWSHVSDFPDPSYYFSDTRNFTIGHKSYFFPMDSWGHINIVFEYDVDTDTWTEKNQSQYNIGGFLRACFSINGVGYVKTNSNTYYYDPTIDSWGLNSSHQGISDYSGQTFVQNNKAYFVGGYSGMLSNTTSEVWEFDPVAQTYIRLEDFPGTSRRFASSFTINDIGYWGTGTNGTNFKDFWKFEANKLVEMTPLFDTENFTAFPNPVINNLTFQSEQYTDYSIQILNPLGQEIERLTAINGTVNFQRNDQASGVYFYNVIHEGRTVYNDKLLFE